MKNLLLCLLGLFISHSYLFAQFRLNVEGDAKIQGSVELFQEPGDSSLFIGLNAGINDDGNSEKNNANTFIGTHAGMDNSSGNFDTYVGFQAGEANRTGSRNTYIGAQAGLNSRWGYQNTFIGVKAGENNGFGRRNTFIGYESGQDNVDGINNTGIGERAGRGNMKGNHNTFLGMVSGSTLDSLEKSIAIGYFATVDCHSCATIGGTGQYAVKVGIGTIKPDEAQFTVLSEEFDDAIEENIAIISHGKRYRVS